MSDILLKVIELPNILFILFVWITMRIVYAGNHFTGSSSAAKTLLILFGFIFSLCMWAYLIITAIKVSIILAVVLFIIGIVFSFILSRIRNRIVFLNSRKEINTANSYDKMLLQATAEHKSDVSVVVFSYIGIILGIPILVYLVSYVINELF